MDKKEYWSSVPQDPKSTEIRREFAGLIKSVEKVVVSDKLTRDELDAWDNTRILKREDTIKEIAAFKEQPGRDIFIFVGCGCDGGIAALATYSG